MVRGSLVRPSLTQLTGDEIIRLVREQGLREGDALPSTGDLATELGVSRTVVREAIAELAGQGLLKRQQGSQTIVSLPGSLQLERLLRLRFAVLGSDLEQVQEIRQSIEVAAASFAAERATEADVEQLRACMQRLRDAEKLTDRYKADLEFHRQVVRCSHNDIMEMLTDALTPLIDELLFQVWRGWARSQKSPEVLVESHQEILNRIEARDRAGAARAMMSNLGEGLLGYRAGSPAN
jgi:GntR family transcriptional repressor for pyruvate dehydrogenase complex